MNSLYQYMQIWRIRFIHSFIPQKLQLCLALLLKYFGFRFKKIRANFQYGSDKEIILFTPIFITQSEYYFSVYILVVRKQSLIRVHRV
jgi:hypothetical protein